MKNIWLSVDLSCTPLLRKFHINKWNRTLLFLYAIQDHCFILLLLTNRSWNKREFRYFLAEQMTTHIHRGTSHVRWVWWQGESLTQLCTLWWLDTGILSITCNRFNDASDVTILNIAVPPNACYHCHGTTPTNGYPGRAAHLYWKSC